MNYTLTPFSRNLWDAERKMRPGDLFLVNKSQYAVAAVDADWLYAVMLFKMPRHRRRQALALIRKAGLAHGT